jgi:hypothetical protein
MQSNPPWRLAFMFDAPNGAYGALEEALKRITSQVQALAGAAHVRVGIADRHPDLAVIFDAETSNSRSVDGAIEISVDGSREAELVAITIGVSKLLTDIAAPRTLEIMAGPYYSMVPVCDGNTFLSLAFRRDPDISSAQFQDWWFNQHAGIAIPALGGGLLAYDQVHLDHCANEKLGQELGIPVVYYDAYDNLTWADRYAFLHSISNEEDMIRVYADEVGKIHKSSQRSALMRKIKV